MTKENATTVRISPREVQLFNRIKGANLRKDFVEGTTVSDIVHIALQEWASRQLNSPFTTTQLSREGKSSIYNLPFLGTDKEKPNYTTIPESQDNRVPGLNSQFSQFNQREVMV